MGDTIAYTPARLSNAAAGGKDGQTHRGGVRFPMPRGLSELTSPTRSEYYNTELYLLLERLWAFLMPLRAEHVGGLIIAVNPGAYRKAVTDDDVEFGGSASFALEDNTSGQKVWIDAASNALAKGTSWPATKSSFVPICQCDTASGALVPESLRDYSNLARVWLRESASNPTGTSGDTFTIDDDATAAGDRTLRFQLGAALWAALKWVNADGRFKLYADVGTPTLAALEALALYIGGTQVLSSAGKLAAAALDASALYTLGANGATAYGLKLTPMAGSGAPASGAHTKGELAVDSGGVAYVCVADGTPGTWVRIGKQDGTAVLSVGNGSASAGNPAGCAIQLQDEAGGSLAQQAVFDVLLFADNDGGTAAPNTSAFSVTTGTQVAEVVAGKHYRVKSNGSGQLVFQVTNSIAGSVYVLCQPAPGTGRLDCSDHGTLAWT